jgi:hypothetical protein
MACGHNAGSPGGSGAGDGGSVSAVTTSASPVVSGQPVPSPPSGDAGSTVPVEPGKVSVTVGASAYPVGTVVSATVANGLDRPVITTDFKTGCTIVILQRSTGGGWTDLTGCQLRRPTMVVTIGPGRGRTVTLDPGSVHLTNSGAASGFGAGTYRVKFTYALESGGDGSEPLTAYSGDFTIR